MGLREFTRAIISLPWTRVSGGGVAVTQDGTGPRLIDLTLGGNYVALKVAMSIPAFNVGVTHISETFATLPISLSRDGVALENHPLDALLNDRANPTQTAVEFKKLGMYSYLTRGGWYAEVVFNGLGDPVELWMLHPDRCEVRREGLIYRDKSQATLLPHGSFLAMMDLPDLSSFDSLKPMDPLHIHAETIQLAAYATLYGMDYFRKGGAPRVLLESSEEAGDSGMQAAVNGVNRTIESGTGVAGLPSGVKAHVISGDPAAAQSLELRRFQVEEIARVLNMPPALLQDLTNGTFSNVEQEQRQFYTDTMRPLIDRFADIVRGTLLTNGEIVQFDTTDLTRGDEATRVAYYSAALTDGWMVASEVRVSEGLPPFTAEQESELEAATKARQPNNGSEDDDGTGN